MTIIWRDLLIFNNILMALPNYNNFWQLSWFLACAELFGQLQNCFQHVWLTFDLMACLLRMYAANKFPVLIFFFSGPACHFKLKLYTSRCLTIIQLEVHINHVQYCYEAAKFYNTKIHCLAPACYPIISCFPAKIAYFMPTHISHSQTLRC